MFHRSDYAFITAAFLSFLFSIYLWFSGHREEGRESDGRARGQRR